MNAAKLVTFCAVREMTFVEQGSRDGVRGAWFETRKRERCFYTEQEVEEFADKVRTTSKRLRAQQTYTS
jgi:hypothetical protein